MSKGLEAVEYIRQFLTCHDTDLIERCNEIETELKALEIINKKGLVNLYVYEPMLTKEEYELLNEVLL